MKKPASEVTSATLLGTALFAPLPVEAREAIARRCQSRQVAAGQTVLSHRARQRDVYFIISGTVRITLYSTRGREVTFVDKGPGEMFGELAALDGLPRSAHVVCLSDARVLSMSPDSFTAILAEHPQCAATVLRALARNVRELSERVFEFSALGVNNRIHAELLRLARKQNPPGNEVLLAPAPKHSDIASRVSTHREAVTKELSRLVRLGVLDKEPDGLRIRDLVRLRRMVDQALADEGDPVEG